MTDTTSTAHGGREAVLPVGSASPKNPALEASLRRAQPSARVAVLMVVVLTLGAALDLIEAEIAVEACAILVLLVAAFYGLLRSGYGLRFADSGLVVAQIALLFLFLAYLSFRTAEFSVVVMLLYPAVMLAGVLRLDPLRLAWLAGLAVASHALVIVATTVGKPDVNFAAIGVHLGTLSAVLALFVYASGYVSRLRMLLVEATRNLHEQSAGAADKARRDELTGAFNKGYLMEALDRETERAERLGKPLCVARVDIDHFREVNAAFGHAIGDTVLARFTAAAHGVARNVDIFGRIGATEFLLLMPDTSLPDASIGAERLRVAIERAMVPELPVGASMTCTIGLSRHEKGDAPAVVLGRAESGLTYAKAAGRNRVMAIEPEKKSG